uniref:Ig-like domain-containing protein n=1 Tax=Latimeria chalumnae TaxID=7897 RepID=H3AGA6_LATCH
ANSWSMKVPDKVTAIKGNPAVLPCTFTSPNKEIITVIWRILKHFTGQQIFNCTQEVITSAVCTSKNENSRYRLVGDPRQKNLSLLIDNVGYEDSMKYFCRVELNTGKYETQTGTDLHVITPARILNLTVLKNTTNGFSLLCLVEGKPLPKITWIGPGNREIPATNSASLVSQLEIPPDQMQGQMQNVMEDGNYTCKAVNEHGIAE